MGTVPITVQVVRLVGNGEGVPRARAALLPAHFVWVPGVVDSSCEMARRRRAVCSSTSTDRPCILPEWTAACYGLSAPPLEGTGLKAKNPKKTYNALSKSDKALIKKELTRGARKTRILGGTSANATMNSATPQNSSGTCWSKGIEASRWGGITKQSCFR